MPSLLVSSCKDAGTRLVEAAPALRTVGTTERQAGTPGAHLEETDRHSQERLPARAAETNPRPPGRGGSIRSENVGRDGRACASFQSGGDRTRRGAERPLP